MSTKEPGRLAKLIRHQRMRLNLFQKDLANAAGVGSAEFISQIEAGHKNLDLDRIPALADALKVDRAGLVKLALFERAPRAYHTLFGETEPGEPADSVPRIQTEAEELQHKLEVLSKEDRLFISNFVDKLYKGVREETVIR